MRGSPFSVLWRARAFLGASGGSPWRAALVTCFWVTGGRQRLWGPLAQRRPSAGGGGSGLPLGLSGCPLPPPTLRTLPLLFPVPWAVAQQAVNISWWCRRAKLVKSESLSLYIIPTEKLPRRPYSSLSPGKPSTDTQWLLFSCHQRMLLFKKKKQKHPLFNRIFHTPTHKSRESHTEAHIPFTQLQPVFMFCQSRFFSVVPPPLFLVLFLLENPQANLRFPIIVPINISVWISKKIKRYFKA